MTNENPFTSFCLTTPDATATAEIGPRSPTTRRRSAYARSTATRTPGTSGSPTRSRATWTAPRRRSPRPGRRPFFVPQRAVAPRQLRPGRRRGLRLRGDTGGKRRRPARPTHHSSTSRSPAAGFWITGRCVERRHTPAARADVPREHQNQTYFHRADARHHHLGDQRRSPGLQPQLLLGRRRRHLQ